MKKPKKKSNIIREILIVSHTVIIFPFFFIYRLFFKIPDSYSPLLGAFRGAVSFKIICWLTSEQGATLERGVSLYLSSYMDIDLAKLIVDSFGLVCCILFFISVLIIGGFHTSIEYDGDINELNMKNSLPNISHALKDFDRRLGYGSVHGLVGYVKQIIK